MLRFSSADATRLRGFRSWVRTRADQRRFGWVALWMDNEDRGHWQGIGRPQTWGELWEYAAYQRQPRLDEHELKGLLSAFSMYQTASGSPPPIESD